jgi:hypothetical protein
MSDEQNSYAAATPRKSSKAPWVLTGLLAAFSGGLIANPWFESEVRSRLPDALQSKAPASVSAGQSAGLAAVEQRLTTVEQRPAAEIPADLSGRIAALEASRSVDGATAGAATVDTTVIDQRLAVVEGRLATSEAAAQGAAQAANAAQSNFMVLDNKLAMTSAKLERDGVALRAMASAMALRGIVDQGRPLGALDDSLALLVGAQNRDMLTLRRVERGGPTLASLRNSFRQLRPSLATQAEIASGDWTDRALVQVKSLLAVRPTDGPNAGKAIDPTNQTPDAMVPLIDDRLRSGDIAGAAAAIRLLPKPAQDKAASWLGQADAYVQVRAALTRLELQALNTATQLAAAPAPLPAVTVAPSPVVAPPPSLGGPVAR